MTSTELADAADMREAMRAFNRGRSPVQLPRCAGSDCPGTLFWSDGDIVCSHCTDR